MVSSVSSPPVDLQDLRSQDNLPKDMRLAVPRGYQQDYMLAMVVRQQILAAGKAYSIEFQQMVEAVQLGIPAKA